MRQTLFALSLLVFTSLFLYVRASANVLPVVSDHAPEQEFSALRALVHLRNIARSPRPVGSSENERVRHYLVETLRHEGVDVRILKGSAVRTLIPRVHAAGNVYNVLAVIPGKRKDSFLFLTHYDSVPTGPGAADNGASVVSALETIRALSKEKPEDTLQFLFTDGEEAGLLGAASFVSRAENTSNVVAVFDFEARGISGESFLFQTGKKSSGLLQAFLENASGVAGSSLGPALYDLLPNDTDFSVFKRRNFAGLDFAFIGDVQAYHTSLDRPENLDLRTLQHQGENMLTLARTREILDSNIETYFSPWPGIVLHYGSFVTRSFLILLLILAVLASRVIALRRSAAAFLYSIACIAVAALIGFGSWPTLSWLNGSTASLLGQPHNYFAYQLYFISLGVSAVFLIRFFVLRRYSTEEVSVAFLWTAAACSVAAVILAPGAAYIFLLPAIACAVCILLSRRFPGGFFSPAFALIFALSIVLIAWDPISGLFLALTVRAGFLAVILVCFYLLLALHFVDLMLSTRHTLILSTVMFALLAAAVRVLSESPGPVLNSLAYGSEVETGKAFYFSCAEKNDSFTSRFFGQAVRTGVIPAFPVMKQCLSGDLFQLATAPVFSNEPPVLQYSSERRGKKRWIHAKITSPRHASGLIVSVHTNPEIEKMVLFGRELPMQLEYGEGKKGLQFVKRILRLDEWHTIMFAGLDEKGMELELEVNGNSTVEIRVTDRSRTILSQRPPGMIEAPEFPFSDGVFITRTFKL